MEFYALAEGQNRHLPHLALHALVGRHAVGAAPVKQEIQVAGVLGEPRDQRRARVDAHSRMHLTMLE
eukprot:9490305-Pyramimonas_sp.AAC.1